MQGSVRPLCICGGTTGGNPRTLVGDGEGEAGRLLEEEQDTALFWGWPCWAAAEADEGVGMFVSGRSQFWGIFLRQCVVCGVRTTRERVMMASFVISILRKEILRSHNGPGRNDYSRCSG